MEVDINSPQSHNETVGAIVLKYNINGKKKDKKIRVLFIFLFVILSNFHKVEHMFIIHFKYFFYFLVIYIF